MNKIEDINLAQAYMVGMLYAAFGWRVKAEDSMPKSASVRMASRLSCISFARCVRKLSILTSCL